MHDVLGSAHTRRDGYNEVPTCEKRDKAGDKYNGTRGGRVIVES